MGMKNMVLVPGMAAMPWAILVVLACCHRGPSELLLSLAYSATKLAYIWVEGIAIMAGSVYWAGRWVGSLCGMESMEVQRAVGSMFGMGFGRASDSVGQKHWQGCAVAGGDSGIIVAMGQWGNP